MIKTNNARAFLWSSVRSWFERVRRAVDCLTAEGAPALPDGRCRCGGKGTWTVNARFSDDNPGTEIVEFLADHGVPFEEASACGLHEVLVRCTADDAMRLGNALRTLGTKELLLGELSCLLIIKPGGKS
jgi:hypothetical protein